MDSHNKRLCQCGHDLDLHGASGCMAGNSQDEQCSCSRSQSGVLALFPPPAPLQVSLQPVREPDVDAILNELWTVQKHHQAEREEQVRILGERRTQSGRKSP
jgi:hypothetical protein